MNRFNDAQIKEGPYAVTVKDGILYADIKKLSFCEIVIPCKNI